MKRLGIYVIYDEDCIIDDYIPFFLKSVIPLFERMIVVCNGLDYSQVQLDKLSGITNEIIIRENAHYDAGAIRTVLVDYLGWSEVEKYDYTIVMNDTYFGPFYPLNSVFDRMERDNVDLWGLLGRLKGEYGNANLFGAFFYGMSRALIQNEIWKEFWENIDKRVQTFAEAVKEYEYQLIPKCEECGCIWDMYWRADKYNGQYIESNFDDYVNSAYELIKYHKFPFLKRKPLVQDKSFTLTNEYSARKAIDYLENNNLYDTKLIWKNILRKYPLSDVMEGLQLNQVVIPQNTNTAIGGIDIFVNNVQDDLLVYYCDYAKMLPKSVQVCIKSNVFCNNERIIAISEDFYQYIETCDSDAHLLVVIDDSSWNSDTKSIAYRRGLLDLVWECLVNDENYLNGVVASFVREENLGVAILAKQYCNDFIGSYSKESNICDVRAYITRRDLFDSIASKYPARYKDSYPECVALEGKYTKRFYSQKIAEVDLCNVNSLMRKMFKRIAAYDLTVENQFGLGLIGISSFLMQHKVNYIYGAGVYGKRILSMLDANLQELIEGFVVSDGNKTLAVVEHKTVYELSEIKAKDVGIIIATVKNQQSTFIDNLRKIGLNDYFCVY